MIVTMLIAIGAALAGGVLAGLGLWISWDWYDDRVDAFRLRLNRLQDRFAAAGASWLSELLALMVVGDEEQVARKVTEFFETDDTTGFFLTNVAVPCGVFAIRETAGGAYPELFARLQAAMDAAGGKGNGAAKA